MYSTFSWNWYGIHFNWRHFCQPLLLQVHPPLSARQVLLTEVSLNGFHSVLGVSTWMVRLGL